MSEPIKTDSKFLFAWLHVFNSLLSYLVLFCFVLPCLMECVRWVLESYRFVFVPTHKAHKAGV